MIKSTRRNTPLILWTVVLLIAALLIVGFVMEDTERTASRNLETATNLLLKIRTVQSLMVDMQTSTRGYAISGKEEFLQPYLEAQQRLPALWQDLETRAVEVDRDHNNASPGVAGLVADMKSKAESWIHDSADAVIQLRRSGRAQEALNFIAAGTTNAEFNAFRDATSRTQEYLDRFVSDFTHAVNRISTIRQWTLLGLGIMALVSAIFAAQVARRETQLQEQAIRASEARRQRLQVIIESLPIPVRLLRAPDGNTELQNQPSAALFPADEWDSLKLEERLAHFGMTRPDGSPLPFEESPLGKSMREGVTLRDFEILMSRPHIGTKNFLISTAPLRDEQGQVMSVVIVLQDVTELKQMDQRKDEFIATAAHELRSPLAALTAQVQLLRKLCSEIEAPPKVSDYLVSMGLQVKRLNALIDHVLDASRIQLGRLILFRSKVDLVQVAETIIADAKAAGNGAHAIELQAPGASLIGDWDLTRIEQVLTNLVSNATRYSPPNTRIEVRISATNGQARVEVSDQGPGIPEEQRLALFNRYYQAGENQSKGASSSAPYTLHRGLGLGLYISSEIVKAHGGEIGVEPNRNGGSTFWFTLPIEVSDSPGLALQTFTGIAQTGIPPS